ncbi:uncharacterized protein JCM10292_001149 [Rhodotorula paludigena]|uniref:uncharacterized protein n=1 Tax=Rhodotorula paludigena TaxID=86838 RepID=UPI003177A0C4
MLPDVHPDGDPFAEQDKERFASSLLGRMERAALASHDAPPGQSSSPSHAPNGFAPPRPPTVKRESSGAKVPRARQSLGTDAHGKEILIVDSDDSDEDEGDEDDDGAASGEEDEDDEGGSGSDDDDVEASGTGTPKVPVEEDDDDDDDSEEDDSDDDSSSTASGARDDVDMATGEARPKSPKKGDGADGDAEMKDGEGDTGAEGEGKEKKKRRRKRQQTPTPPPLEPKERRATVRLEVTLPPRKGVEVPDYNVHELAKAAGFIKEEEEPKKGDDGSEEEGSESDGQGGRRPKKGKEKAAEPTAEGGADGAPPKKRRKRGPNVVLGRFGGYDVNDPFVDDEEIALYEPRFSARPKREGYFIVSGEVEVAPRRGRVKGSKNKPKFDENGNPVPSAAARRRSNKVVVGADGKPIHADESNPNSPAPGVPAFGGGLPAQPEKKVRKPGEFSQELLDDFEMLKREVANTSWVQKNKFPPDLKETLLSVALHALRIDEYDDDFFAMMPKIFPYNLFTMKKLIKREVYPTRINEMSTQQDDLLKVVQKQIDTLYPIQRAEFERKLAEYEHAQEHGLDAVANGAAAAAAAAAARKTPEPPSRMPGFGDSPAIATPLLGAIEGADGSPAPGKDDEDEKTAAEPKWRFRFNDTIRDALYRAGELEDKKSELTSEKQTLEKATTREVDRQKPYSGKNARKQLYQRIVNMWPDDSVTSNQISREISNYKLKLKKNGELPADA